MIKPEESPDSLIWLIGGLVILVNLLEIFEVISPAWFIAITVELLVTLFVAIRLIANAEDAEWEEWEGRK